MPCFASLSQIRKVIVRIQQWKNTESKIQQCCIFFSSFIFFFLFRMPIKCVLYKRSRDWLKVFFRYNA